MTLRIKANLSHLPFIHVGNAFILFAHYEVRLKSLRNQSEERVMRLKVQRPLQIGSISLARNADRGRSRSGDSKVGKW